MTSIDIREKKIIFDARGRWCRGRAYSGPASLISLTSEERRTRPHMGVSIAGPRTLVPWVTNPQLLALEEKTLDVGLRRAGFPDK
jgi:hypothetical protein